MKVTQSSNEHAELLYNRTTAFEKEQEDIDLRVMLVTQSSSSDEAVRKFEASMDKLRRLDIAEGYMDLLTNVNRLRCVRALRCVRHVTVLLTGAVKKYKAPFPPIQLSR
jgi:hypothetical protein